MLSLSRSFAFYVFSFSSITSITNHIKRTKIRKNDNKYMFFFGEIVFFLYLCRKIKEHDYEVPYRNAKL